MKRRTNASGWPQFQLTEETLKERITITSGGCWEWQGLNRTGYGRVKISNPDPGPCPHCGQQMPPGRAKHVFAHRAVWEMLRGPIPEGLQIDHLCRNRACVNPDHLEPVTAKENMHRAAVLITHCPKGHPYDDTNTYWHKGHRGCRICRAAAVAKWNAANPGKLSAIRERAKVKRQKE